MTYLVVALGGCKFFFARGWSLRLEGQGVAGRALAHDDDNELGSVPSLRGMWHVLIYDREQGPVWHDATHIVGDDGLRLFDAEWWMHSRRRQCWKWACATHVNA